MRDKTIARRWLYLVLGVVSMLFAGVIYAWSILKSPFTNTWDASQLALNFTITMTCFCTGGFVGAKLNKRFGVLLTTLFSAALSCAGFALATLQNCDNLLLLYLSYGVLAGLGIGIAYIVVISTVSAWFPDKKGFCSGCLMMGFGASSLLIGNLISAVMDQFDWKTAYIALGCVLGAVLALAALILKNPDENTVLPAPKAKKVNRAEAFERKDYSAGEIVRRPSFWMAFLYIAMLAAVGNSVISFARDLALSVDASIGLATTLVGVLSVCNGLGRIFTGAIFDAMGRRFTMLAANFLTIIAAGVTLLAVVLHSLPLCIVGLCLVGLSYGTCPTVAAAFVSEFYGAKHFATNLAMINFNIICSSLAAAACGSLLVSTGGYTAPFIVLICLASGALVLNLIIRKP